MKYDVVVAGGGFAGAAAAISAAREGAKVLLFDKANCLGGAAVNNLVVPFMGYWTTDPVDGSKKYLSKGIFTEIVEELTNAGAMDDECTFSEEYLKILLNRMAVDAGVELLFHAYLASASCENGQVKSIQVASKSGLMKIEGDYFIDATGDGDLAALCGCEYQLGREEDGLCQPMTLCFRISGIDFAQFLKESPDMQALYKQYKEEGKIKNERENILSFRTLQKDVIHFNSTRVIKRNPTDAFDVTAAEIEAREQAYELFEFLKANFGAFKNSHLMMTATEIGVRESRKIQGEYLLTAEDLKDCKVFEDSIAAGNYDIDIHNPAGSGTSHYYFKPGEYYTIPYRSLTPKATKNLLVAGRCISSTHEAQASYRIMPICACLGQAAGVAAAMAKVEGCGVKEIDIKMLQGRLEELGAMVK